MKGDQARQRSGYLMEQREAYAFTKDHGSDENRAGHRRCIYTISY